MSLKEDVGYIKNELSSEEKFIENFVKGERFFRTNAEDPEITIPHIFSRSRSGCCVCPPG